MKIDDTPSGANSIDAVNRAQMSPGVSSVASGKPESGSTNTSVGGSDSATLSAGAKLASHMANVSDVRMDKVNHVQQALAAGTYQVPSSEVAGKMIDQMLGK